MENEIEYKQAFKTIKNFIEKNEFKRTTNNSKHYSFNEFWFYELKLSDENEQIKKFQRANIINENEKNRKRHNILPVSFDIRYEFPGEEKGLRYRIRTITDKKTTKKFFGKTKLGSRIFVSHIFKKKKEEKHYWLRTWGFTEKDVGVKIGEELENIFGENIPEITLGANIINER